MRKPIRPIPAAFLLASIALAPSIARGQSPHTLPADLADPGTPILIPRTGGGGSNVFGEGVAADWQGNVYFNEQSPSNKTMQLKAGADTARFWRQAGDVPNGMWLDYNHNRLVICQQKAIVRVNAGAAFDNTTDTLYKYSGQDLNDVTGDSKGNLFFTNYMGGNLFFRNAATGETKTVFTDIKRPNGVEWDEERKRLYLHEFGIDTVAVYDVGEDYALSNRRAFASVAACDGITFDERGDVYSVSFTTGVVHVHDPDGNKLGEIAIKGQQMTNLAFGGPDFKTLFFITNRGLYKLPMKVKGYKVGQPSVSLGRPSGPFSPFTRSGLAGATGRTRGVFNEYLPDGRRLAAASRGAIIHFSRSPRTGGIPATGAGGR